MSIGIELSCPDWQLGHTTKEVYVQPTPLSRLNALVYRPPNSIEDKPSYSWGFTRQNGE